MHPLAQDLDQLKDSEVEEKINDLTRKYFLTQNTGMKMQISLMLDTYKEVISDRRRNEWQKMMDNRDKGLDKLINIS